MPAPSRRSLLIGLAIVAVAASAYTVARETSVFAIRHIVVRGGTPLLRAQVRRELATLKGTNLLALDGSKVERRVEGLPWIVSATYDRAFPYTLRVTVVPEQPVAVLHSGTKTWLVSGRARVLAPVAVGTHAGLPRIWVPTSAVVVVGGFLAAGDGAIAAKTLSLVQHFPARIATATLSHGELTFTLRNHVQVRFGAPVDMRLKLAIARRALTILPSGSAYLDVSVPGRPVAGP